jgi:hypothetical protein
VVSTEYRTYDIFFYGSATYYSEELYASRRCDQHSVDKYIYLERTLTPYSRRVCILVFVPESEGATSPTNVTGKSDPEYINFIM